MKIKNIVTLILFIVSLSVTWHLGFNSGKNEVVKSSTNDSLITTNNALTMMLETEAGSGEYALSNSGEWPGEGYTFNSELSRCENGGELSWDSETNRVVMQSNSSDRCYVYFDVYVPRTLADVCPSGGNLASCIADLNTLAGDGVDSIYYHDADLANGAEDNSYRYSGADPNNYVCFGSTENTCPEENLYRIIGIFDDDGDSNYQIKLIKADYTTSTMLGTDGRDYYGTYDDGTSSYQGTMDTSTIAAYRWNYDTSVSTYGLNNWSTSEFNTINLNTNYWNYLGTTWQNLIATTTWYLGGLTSNNNTAKVFYDGERNNPGYSSNPTSYRDEIGLMYPSDYGYAASPDSWTTDLNSYSSSTITSNNWLYMGLYEWTITPRSSRSYYVFNVYSNGLLNDNYPNIGYAVRPAFYLNSNVTYISGDGTMQNPYRIQ